MRSSSQLFPTWDRFADEILPVVGLPSLRSQLSALCPTLSADRVDYGVAQFNDVDEAIDSRFALGSGDLTEEEMDGIWYDRMKAIAVECLNEIDERHKRV